jgi:hypothetical protein
MPVLISHFSHRQKKHGGLAKSSSRSIHALKEKPKPPAVQLDLIAVTVVNCKSQEIAEKKHSTLILTCIAENQRCVTSGGRAKPTVSKH